MRGAWIKQWEISVRCFRSCYLYYCIAREKPNWNLDMQNRYNFDHCFGEGLPQGPLPPCPFQPAGHETLCVAWGYSTDWAWCAGIPWVTKGCSGLQGSTRHCLGALGPTAGRTCTFTWTVTLPLHLLLYLQLGLLHKRKQVSLERSRKLFMLQRPVLCSEWTKSPWILVVVPFTKQRLTGKSFLVQHFLCITLVSTWQWFYQLATAITPFYERENQGLAIQSRSPV